MKQKLEDLKKLSPDAAGPGPLDNDSMPPAPEGDPNDPMNQEVGDIDTTMPRIVPGLYTLEIVQAKVQPSKERPEASTMALQLKTTQPAMTTTDEQVDAGFPLYHYIGVTPTEKMSDKKVAANIAALAQAAGLTGVTPRQIKDNPSLLEHKIVAAKVKIEKETDSYPESNKIARFIPVETA